MLTYQRTNSLDAVGYNNADFKGCVNDKKSTTRYIFFHGRRSWVVAECQAIYDSILDYGCRICGLL